MSLLNNLLIFALGTLSIQQLVFWRATRVQPIWNLLCFVSTLLAVYFLYVGAVYGPLAACAGVLLHLGRIRNYATFMQKRRCEKKHAIEKKGNEYG